MENFDEMMSPGAITNKEELQRFGDHVEVSNLGQVINEELYIDPDRFIQVAGMVEHLRSTMLKAYPDADNFHLILESSDDNEENNPTMLLTLWFARNETESEYRSRMEKIKKMQANAKLIMDLEAPQKIKEYTKYLEKHGYNVTPKD